MDTILIITNLPDRKSAETLARILVQKRLVACVNILAACTSVYHWQDKVETAEEVPIFIKTTQHCYDAVEKIIKELHPYELPEIIYVPVQGGLPEYLAWVAAETIK